MKCFKNNNLETHKKISSEKLNEIFDAKLSDKDFTKLSKFIQGKYGIKMPPAKKIMLQSRLQKRLRALEITSYSEYVKYVFSKQGVDEVIHMMDVVSTNKTDFFREPIHFEYLRNVFLPEYYKRNKGHLLKVWSAGCSTGEEVYTLTIVLSEFALANPQFMYSIYGTDISTKVLKIAKNAIYSVDRVEVIPLDLKKKYLLRSKDKTKKLVRIVSPLRQKVRFDRLNFMQNDYRVNDTFDIVFCRNVLIYFDRNNQEDVINKLCRNLKTGGLFFFGHSESITGLNVPLEHIKPTIFRKI